MYYNQGYTCTGCAMIVDLPIDIEFTNDEIARMRQLVSKVDEVDYSEGIMPVLKDQAPELHHRIDDVARSKIFEFLVEEGILQGYIEFDEDELHRNFENDMEDGTFEFVASDYFDEGEQPDEESLKEKAYHIWYEREMSNIDNEDLDRIRSRYSVDDQVTMEDDPAYTVDIPHHSFQMSNLQTTTIFGNMRGNAYLCSNLYYN